MREFEIILFQTQSLSIKAVIQPQTFCEAFVVEFYLKVKLTLRIIR
jgi:hypothetical protein